MFDCSPRLLIKCLFSCDVCMESSKKTYTFRENYFSHWNLIILVPPSTFLNPLICCFKLGFSFQKCILSWKKNYIFFLIMYDWTFLSAFYSQFVYFLNMFIGCIPFLFLWPCENWRHLPEIFFFLLFANAYRKI